MFETEIHVLTCLKNCNLLSSTISFSGKSQYYVAQNIYNIKRRDQKTVDKIFIFLLLRQKRYWKSQHVVSLELILCYKLIIQFPLSSFLYKVTPFRAIRKYHEQFVLYPELLLSANFKDILNYPFLLIFTFIKSSLISYLRFFLANIISYIQKNTLCNYISSL